MSRSAILEAGVEDGKITFTTKSLVDWDLVEGLEDARTGTGRTHGPYGSADAAIAALEARAKRPVKKRET